jgi:hypothetical protein
MEELDAKITNFHKNIDEWISGHNINYGIDDSFELAQRVGQIMHFTEDDIKKLSNLDCQAAIFTLNKYIVYTNSLLAREKAVKQWAEQGIWYIITGQKHDQYAKWEEKYHSAIRNSKSGLKLQMLKTTADARILAGEATAKGLEHAIKVLENIARSKSYERS